MLDIILFSLISAAAIALILFLQASSEDDNVEIGEYMKHFLIAFVVNMIAMFIFTNLNNKSPFAEPVEVGLLD